MASMPCPGHCGTQLHYRIKAIETERLDGALRLNITADAPELDEHANRCADWALKVWSAAS